MPTLAARLARPRPLRWTLALLLAALSLPAAARSFTACAEPGDGPPLLYRSPNQPALLLGFTAEFWPLLFRGMGHELRLVDLPFKRCLHAVSTGEVDFVLGAYRDPERERTLVFSVPVRTLTPQVFFRRDRPLALRGRADLKRWHGCGMAGSSYAHYGLAPGDLDQGARSYRTLMEKLMLGRCDYIVEELEVVQRLGLGPVDYLAQPWLDHGPVPDAPAPTIHVAAAQGGAAAALMPALDAAFARAQKSGELMRVWRRHAGDLPF